MDIDEGAAQHTVEIASRNGSFRGLLHLDEFLESREFGRAPGACVEEKVDVDDGGGDGDREGHAAAGSRMDEGLGFKLGRRMTPGEAEEMAGLGSNKNWKKSFM
jgi:hypothetical protein